MRLRARTDENQQLIIDGLRAAHRSVAPLHAVGDGIPDLLVGFQGYNFLLEVKRDKKAKLTPDQLEFHASWRGQRAVVTNLEEALNVTAARKSPGFYLTGKNKDESRRSESSATAQNE